MAEVTIYGAGIFGLSIGWACARRGAAVQIYDPSGVAAGSSGGPVGALAPHVPENWNTKKAFQFDSLIAAQDFWQGVEEASGLSSGYGRSGRLQPIADEKNLRLAREREISAQTLWQGQATWRVIRSDAQTDWGPQSPTSWLIHDTLSARIHPLNACLALAKALRASGGRIELDGPEHGAVVHATGWQGLHELNEHFNQPVGNGVKGQAALLRYYAPDAPQLFTDAIHIVPHADGTVAIGSTSERAFSNSGRTDAKLDAVISRATEAFPELRDAPVIARWAGVRPRTKSCAPMLGAFPGRAGHFIANGGFKIGFGMAPKIAEVMADLILEGRNTIPDAFRVETCLNAGPKT
ncbi:MAG: FAD-binding oxidoreductase [Paracoccaceae bacterium]|nr:FAD-binding oxidoreductase [Paracoccaceae bacterium]